MAYELRDINENPIKRGKDIILAQDFLGVVKAANVERRFLQIVGTDETKDRMGDIIDMKGWELENYLKNPVILWAHDYRSVPIGGATKLIKKQNPKRMEFWIKFPTKGLYPFADMILELYAEKIINASSVGFIPKEFEELEKDENDVDNWRRGRRYIKQELLELSGCPVPANPNALQNALIGKSFSGIPGEEMYKWMSREMPDPEHKDDILEELLVKPLFIDETAPVQVQVPVTWKRDEEDESGSIIVPEQLIDHDNISVTVDNGTVFSDIKENLAEVEEDIPFSDLEDGDYCGIDEEVTPIDAEEKPYPNEHACRINDPGKYDTFARKNCFRRKNNKCMDFIFGIKAGKSDVQAVRFKKAVWDAASARSVCSGMGGSFEPASGKETEELRLDMNAKFEEEKLRLMESRIDSLEESLKNLLELLKAKSETAPDQTIVNDPEEKVEEGAGEKILKLAFVSHDKDKTRNLILGKIKIEPIEWDRT